MIRRPAAASLIGSFRAPLWSDRHSEATPSPPTKSSAFRGFDSSRLLILRGGNSHVHIIL